MIIALIAFLALHVRTLGVWYAAPYENGVWFSFTCVTVK